MGIARLLPLNWMYLWCEVSPGPWPFLYLGLWYILWLWECKFLFRYTKMHEHTAIAILQLSNARLLTWFKYTDYNYICMWQPSIGKYKAWYSNNWIPMNTGKFTSTIDIKTALFHYFHVLELQYLSQPLNVATSVVALLQSQGMFWIVPYPMKTCW